MFMRFSKAVIAFVIVAMLTGLIPAQIGTLHAAANRPPIAETMDLRLLVVYFDPYLPTRGGVRVSDYMGSEPIHLNIDDLVERLHRASHGIINYYHIEYVHLNEFPLRTDGFRLDTDTFVRFWDDVTRRNMSYWDHPTFQASEAGFLFDYDHFIAQLNLVERRNRGEFDVVWVISPFSCSFGGMFESVMVGRGAYWINGTPVEADCLPFRIMTINRSRFDTPLENLAHSVESIMRRIYGRWDNDPYIIPLGGIATPRPDLNIHEFNTWERFTMIDAMFPGNAAVGVAHFAPNSTVHYEWNNPRLVDSTWRDWRYNFPNLTGESSRVNVYTWHTGACLNRDWHTWWFSAFPHVQGRCERGFSHNWWLYFQEFVYTTSLHVEANWPSAGAGFMICYENNIDVQVFAVTSDWREIEVTFDSTIKKSRGPEGEIVVTAWRDGQQASTLIFVEPVPEPEPEPTPQPSPTPSPPNDTDVPPTAPTPAPSGQLSVTTDSGPLTVTRSTFDILAPTLINPVVISESVAGALAVGTRIYLGPVAYNDGYRIAIPAATPGSIVLNMLGQPTFTGGLNLREIPGTIMMGWEVISSSTNTPGTITFGSIMFTGGVIPGVDYAIEIDINGGAFTQSTIILSVIDPTQAAPTHPDRPPEVDIFVPPPDIDDQEPPAQAPLPTPGPAETANRITGEARTISAGGQHAFAITTDGVLWGWGLNWQGQLGDGTLIDRRSPVRIMENAVAVSSSSHTMAITIDGTLWGWGNNCSGQVGDGTFMDRIRPVPIMEDVIAVSAGGQHTMAVTSGGSLWAWGSNINGILGDGTAQGRRSPVRIMENVIAVSAGSGHSMAITEDGVLWGWGNNGFGEIGDGTTEHRWSPVRILDDVASVFTDWGMTMAITNDGSLWAWGGNHLGQLGDGTTINRLTPVRVMENVTNVSAGWTGSMVVTTDGALWVWGQMGLNVTPHIEYRYAVYTPVRVKENVVYVTCGNGIH